MALLAKRDITIDQGATFSWHLRWKDASGSYYDLTGWTAAMQVREEFASATTLASLTTNPGGGIALSSTGDIEIEIPAATTAGLPAPKKAVYDLKLTSPGGKVYRFAEGTCRISPGVTHG